MDGTHWSDWCYRAQRRTCRPFWPIRSFWSIGRPRSHGPHGAHRAYCSSRRRRLSNIYDQYDLGCASRSQFRTTASLGRWRWWRRWRRRPCQFAHWHRRRRWWWSGPLWQPHGANNSGEYLHHHNWCRRHQRRRWNIGSQCHSRHSGYSHTIQPWCFGSCTIPRWQRWPRWNCIPKYEYNCWRSRNNVRQQ